jgi:hypothetical protein
MPQAAHGSAVSAGQHGSSSTVEAPEVDAQNWHYSSLQPIDQSGPRTALRIRHFAMISEPLAQDHRTSLYAMGHNPNMRIGTWNLAARWTRAHAAVLIAADCEVWLLTEVRTDVRIDGFEGVRSPGVMTPGQHYAAVFSRPTLTALEAPHPASALGLIDGLHVCASVLPWVSVGRGEQWIDGTTAEKAAAAVADIVSCLPDQVVWGGDWNHPLEGSDSGYYRGRKITLAAADRLGLQIPTASLPGRHPPSKSIDHIAVPKSWRVRSSEHHIVKPSLSDHDMYMVDIEVPATKLTPF